MVNVRYGHLLSGKMCLGESRYEKVLTLEPKSHDYSRQGAFCCIQESHLQILPMYYEHMSYCC